MSETIQLKFINAVQAVNNPKVVIFQKNLSYEGDENIIAWRVFENVQFGEHIFFEYSNDLEVKGISEINKHTLLTCSEKNQNYEVSSNGSNIEIQLSGNPEYSVDVSLTSGLNNNKLMTANVYRNRRLLASIPNLESKKTANFSFKPSWWIGATYHEVREGEVIPPIILDDFKTEISLLGISRTEIVMNYINVQPGNSPFTFELRDVQR